MARVGIGAGYLVGCARKRTGKEGEEHLVSRFFTRVLSVALVFAMTVAYTPLSATAFTGEVAAAGVEEPVTTLSWGADAVRAQGADRYGTSVAISQVGWTSSEWVVLATAENYPDALVAGPLAGALNAPILLTARASLQSDVADEIIRLGAEHVILVGGQSALSDQVARDLESIGIAPGEIERIGGSSRYETSYLVALRVEQIAGDVQSVVLATGKDFPDALAVSGLAGANGVPILLTQGTELSPAAKRAIDELAAISTLVIGGEAAISSAVESLTPHPRRVGGVDRYDTARLVAEYSFAFGFTYQTIIVATGTNYPDALCAGALASLKRAPVVLTQGTQLTGAADEFFNAHCTAIEDILIAGGTGAISDSVVAAIESAAMTMLSADLEPVSAAEVSDIETISPDGSSFVVPVGSPILDSVETSAVLVSGPSGVAPSGMLLRVLSYSESGGKVTVETTQAALDDVILKGSLDVTGTIDPNEDGTTSTDVMIADADVVDDSTVDVTFDEVERNAGSATEILDVPQPAVLGEVDPLASMGGAVTIPFEAKVGTGGGSVSDPIEVAVAAEGSITFSGDFTANASWGYLYWQSAWWGGYPVYGLQNITLRTYMVETLAITLSYEQSASLTLDIIDIVSKRLNRDLRLHVGTSVQWVGVVPVITEFFLTPIVEVTGSVGGKVAVTFLQSSYLTAGIQYDYGVGWRPIRGCGNAFALYPNIGATASIEAAIGAQLECLLYGVMGPYFGVTGNLGLTADTTEDNWWWAFVAVKGRFGGKIDILGQSTTLWSGEVLFWQKKIAQAAGAFPNTGIEWWPAMLVQNEGVTPEPMSVDAAIVALVEPSQPNVMASLSSSIDASTLQASDFEVPGLTVQSAQLRPDGKTVRLTTSKMTAGTDYLVLLGHESFRTVDDAWATKSGSPFVGYWPVTTTWAAANADDTIELHVDSYSALDATTVEPGDFSVPGLTVTGAAVGADGRTITLDTSAQTPGTRYTVTVGAGAISDKVFDCLAGSADFTGFADYTIATHNLNRAGSTVFEIRGIGNTAYAVGMTGVVSKTTNGGASWARTTNIAPSAAMNTGVGNSYDIGFMGGDVNKVVTGTYAGIISRSTNGGTNWAYFDNDAVTTRHGLSVDFSSATYGISTVGGQLLVTSNAGVTYARHAQDGAVSGVTVRFAPSDPSRGYISGAGGLVYRTDDGGATWALTTGATGTTASLSKHGISPVDPDAIVAVGVGGVIVSSRDGGDTWTVCDSGVTTDLHDVSWADDSVCFVSGQSGKILVSRDKGRTWSIIPAGVVGTTAVSGLWAPSVTACYGGGLNGVGWKITGN